MSKICIQPSEKTGRPIIRFPIRFPCPVKQVGDYTIEVELLMSDTPMFSTSFIEEVAKRIGAGPCDSFIEEHMHKIHKELLLKQTW